MSRLASAAVIVALLSPLCAGCPLSGGHSGGLTVDEERARIAPWLGVQAGDVVGNGRRPPGGWPGDTIWTLSEDVTRGKDNITLTTRHGRIAYFSTLATDRYLRPPGYVPPSRARITADEARKQACELATLYWMQDAPAGATLTVVRAETDRLRPGNYLVEIALANAGRYAPAKAEIDINAGGLGCQSMLTSGWQP